MRKTVGIWVLCVLALSVTSAISVELTKQRYEGKVANATESALEIIEENKKLLEELKKSIDTNKELKAVAEQQNDTIQSLLKTARGWRDDFRSLERSCGR